MRSRGCPFQEHPLDWESGRDGDGFGLELREAEGVPEVVDGDPIGTDREAHANAVNGDGARRIEDLAELIRNHYSAMHDFLE